MADQVAVGSLDPDTKFTWSKDSREFTVQKLETGKPFVWVTWWSEGIRHAGEMHIGERVTPC